MSQVLSELFVVVIGAMIKVATALFELGEIRRKFVKCLLWDDAVILL